MPDSLTTFGLKRRAGNAVQHHSSEPKANQPRQYFYRRLFEFSLEHSFYNHQSSQCPDFAVTPTKSTTLLMANWGLLFKPQQNGFAILFNGLAVPALPEGHKNTGLYFILTLKNPLFANFTEMPLDTNFYQHNYYFEITEDNTQGSSFSVPLLERVAAQYRIDFKPPTDTKDVATVIEVKNSHGTGVFYLVSRQAFAALSQYGPPQVTMDNINHALSLKCRCCDENNSWMDFSGSPMGRYNIHWHDLKQDRLVKWLKSGENSDLTMAIDDKPVLYTENVNRSISVGFVDLPLALFTGMGKVDEAVDFLFNFESRSTYWIYWLIPGAGRLAALDNKMDRMRIQAQHPQSNKVTFTEPKAGILAGQKAWWCVSTTAIELVQHCTDYFKLIEVKDDGAGQYITDRLNPLPIADVQQLFGKSWTDKMDESMAQVITAENAETAVFSQLFIYL